MAARSQKRPKAHRSRPRVRIPAALVVLVACVGCRAPEHLLVIDDGGVQAGASATTRDGGDAVDAGIFYDMGVTPPRTCPAYEPGADFAVCTATYVGGPSHDRASGVAITPSGEILLSGLLAELASVQDVRRLYTAGSGAVLRLDATGSRMLSLTRIGQRVNDLAVDRETGAVVIATDFGVAVGVPSVAGVGGVVVLQEGAERVDIGEGERVAAITGTGELAIFDADGTLRGQHWVDAAAVNDVAVDGARGLVFLVGEIAGQDCAATLPFLRAYDMDGQLVWSRYDDPTAAGLCAASTGTRVIVGADGALYYAGHSEGEDSVHRMDPEDASQPVALSSYDAFTSADGVAQQLALLARFDPEDGSLVRAQVLVPRDGSRAGRLMVNGLAADAAGQLYVAGEAGCCLDARDDLRVAGQSPGPYQAGDPFVAILAPDFDARLSWVTWTGDNASASRAVAVAVARGMAAVVVNQPDADGVLITREALLEEPPGNGDAFLATWRAAPAD